MHFTNIYIFAGIMGHCASWVITYYNLDAFTSMKFKCMTSSGNNISTPCLWSLPLIAT